MPEISEERLAHLESLETIIRQVVLPLATRGGMDATKEEMWKYPNDLTDEETKDLMIGHAMWDDPPKGWTQKKLATWSRGYLYGRMIVGGNVSQSFYRIIQALRDPVRYWRGERLAFLDLCIHTRCADTTCTGVYTLDKERIGLVCSDCQRFESYEQVCVLMRWKHVRK